MGLQKEKKKGEEPATTDDVESELAKAYVSAIEPPPSPPPVHAHPERAPAEWEKDKIELAQLKYAKDMIRSRKFPSYFDTEDGQNFLTSKGMIMNKLASDLAVETLHPTHRTPSVASTNAPSVSPKDDEMSATPNGGDDSESPKGDKMEELKMEELKLTTSSVTPMLAESSMSVLLDDGISPYPSLETQTSRPLNPTPATVNAK